MSESKSSSGGIGILGVTFIVFLILKLSGIGEVASWSWWWITAPLWIPICAGISVYLLSISLAIVFVSLRKNNPAPPVDKKDTESTPRKIERSGFRKRLEQKIKEQKERN